MEELHWVQPTRPESHSMVPPCLYTWAASSAAYIELDGNQKHRRKIMNTNSDVLHNVAVQTRFHVLCGCVMCLDVTCGCVKCLMQLYNVGV